MHYYTNDVSPLLAEALKTTYIRSLADVGCGEGAVLYALKKNGLLFMGKVYAMDKNLESVSKACSIDPKIMPYVCYAENCNKTGFDFIICNQVIEHIDDQVKLIKTLYKMLFKGGTLYLSTVYKQGGWYFYRNKGKWVLDPTHVREYTDDRQLTCLLTKCFSIEKQAKTLFRFPLVDFFLKRFGAKNNIYENRFFRFLRKIQIPIYGYYEWQLVCRKA